MKKLTAKKIVDFRKLSDARKKTFINELLSDKKGGRDYWVRSLSAISTAYEEGNNSIIKEKLEEIQPLYAQTLNPPTKIQYGRNIDILKRYKSYDFSTLKPKGKIEFYTKVKTVTLNVRGLNVHVTPSHVFSIKKSGVNEFGAIWFVAKLEGYTNEELGIFVILLYKSLLLNLPDNHEINPKYCSVVEVVKSKKVNYSGIAEEEIASLLDATVDEIKLGLKK